MKSHSILITGATGNVGRELIKILSAQKVPFRAMVRSITKGQDLVSLPGATQVEGDFNDTDSIRKAVQGIDYAFLLTSSSEQAEMQQNNFVSIAQEMGVRHIVKLSQWAADLQSPVRFLRYHAAVENKIRQSGMAYTFLRPNLFMQGLLGFKDTIINQQAFFAAAGTARITAVDIRDIAAVAAVALTHPGHKNKIYDITGPEALTHDEMAEKFSKALARPIQFVDVQPAVMQEALLKVGFPQWQAEGLIEDYAHYRRNEASTVTSSIQEVTGKPARTFDSFVHDYVAAFS